MVEINNQRAFLDMLARSEGTDNGRQKIRNQGGYGCHCRRSYLLITPITLAQTCHAKPKLNQQADVTSFFPAGGMPTVSSLA